jgi:hypothetical protein
MRPATGKRSRNQGRRRQADAAGAAAWRRAAARDAKIQALVKQLETSGSLKDAAALIAARRKGGR